MNITVNVTLNDEQQLRVAVPDVAAQVLELLGGDPARDTCTVIVLSQSAIGPGVEPPAASKPGEPERPPKE